MNKSIVIIGSSIAGMTAAIAAKDTCPQCSVTVLDEDLDMPYRRPSITSILEGTTRDIEDIAIYHDSARELGIKILRGFKAIDLNASNQVLKVMKIDGSTSEITYDVLILATGAKVSKLDIEGVNLKGVFTFRSAKDALDITKYIEHHKKVVIIGASFTALLTAEALIKRGLKISMVVRSRVLRRLVEPSTSDIIESYLKKVGVNLLKKVTVEKIIGENKVEKVLLSDGRIIDADVVIFAIGSKPRVDLAMKAGTRIVQGVIDVNKFMETSIPNIYAAGDCAYSWDLITGNKIYVPTATTASTFGKVAGLNAVGKSIEAPKIIRIQYERFLDLEIISAGYTSDEAIAVGLPAKHMDLTNEIIRRYNLWRTNIIKLDVTLGSKDRIIGVRVIGLHNSRLFAYPFIYAIAKGLKLSDVLEKLHPTIPAFSREPMFMR